mmetsp:Transcript_1086/g.3909  ORF Transcript_1086/g.3909 Transcript_1086/m.3909 type:complete len:256 (+) Transcript_1086:168-935(+)|eukprot:CAMPEP_0114612260 /NCGR_PEP_ID=MMETSP0168-20121206/4532_1 /TAXON_ID=95228 ORGANISM="Vannella sp., Strain DIVA3 517/6/12" /NCGR_SAMPLE_ID=MMETSP0168 /ASSEMBLY_ACC=CAM_ASM_000044 /LENGTH=255 /DNA_ID=CAMNT_0001823243 /DNA_START=152 /DNA_END=919 /DNA_ORIENTATION=-
MSTAGDTEEPQVPLRTQKREAGKICKAIKLGVVGDGTVGKTTMLMAYTLHAFLDEYTPTVFDNFSVIEEVDDRLVNIILWDTAGQEDYKQLRTSTYQKTDIFMLCFSVVHPSSFENLRWWMIELKKHCPNTPLVLCGTKIDLRDDPETIANLEATGQKMITKKAGTKKAKECKARAYLECSAKDVDSVTQVFQQAVKVVMDKDKKMWADVHKKAKKEEKAEAKKIAKIEARMKKMQKATSKNEVADVDELLPDEE